MSRLANAGAWVWRLLVPQRTSMYDRSLLVLAFSLMAIGLIMVASASITEGMALQNDPFFFVKRHLLFLVLCIAAGTATLYVPMKFWQEWGARLLVLSIFLLVVVLVAGHSVNGARRWLPIGPFNLQPAEIAKLVLIAYLSGYLVRRIERSSSAAHAAVAACDAAALATGRAVTLPLAREVLARITEVE